MDDLGALVQFAAGYLVILLTPGPNLIAIGSTAALRGLRAAMPFCAGLALGAGFLCAAVAFAAGAKPWGDTGIARVAGVCLLVWVAVSVLRGRAKVDGETGPPARATVEGVGMLGAGFLVAFSNPLTAAYFLSAFVGSSAALPWRLAATACVPAAAFSVFLLVAGVLSRPALRPAALRWDGPIRLAAAALLALMAARSAWPLLHG